MTDIEFIDHSTVSLESYQASDEAVARAAWVSFGPDARTKEAGRIAGLINFLYANKHSSPFEHGIFTFFIDTPIFVVREFHRHRTWSYNEVSGRYTIMGPRFYVPSAGRPLVQQGKPGDYSFVPGNSEQYAQMIQAKRKMLEGAWQHYEYLLGLGIAKEMARTELPLSTMTQFYASTDPRNLMAFLTLRTDSHALHEIREVADKIEALFADKMPLTYEAFVQNRGLMEKVSNLFGLSLNEEEWEEVLSVAREMKG